MRTKFVFIFFVWMLVELILFPAESYAREVCKTQLTKSSTNIIKIVSEVEFDDSQPQSYLNERFRTISRNADVKTFPKAGLTEKAVMQKFNLEYFVIDFGNNMRCIAIDRAIIHIGFQSFKIFVANKFEKESCRYRVIKKHEETHVKISKRVLEEFLPEYRKVMSSFIERQEITSNKRTDEIGDQMMRQVQKKSSSLLSGFMEIMAKENGKIDVEEKVRQEYATCLN